MGNLTTTKSGEIASFFTGKQSEIRSLKVHFSPKQDGSGDPSPDNVREISGWGGVEINGCGKNLFNPSTITEKYYIDGDTGELISNSSFNASDYIKVEVGQYIFTAIKLDTTNAVCKCVGYDSNKNYVKQIASQASTKNNYSFQTEIDETISYVRIQTYKNISNIQYEHASTATAYQSYQGYTNEVKFVNNYLDNVTIISDTTLDTSGADKTESGMSTTDYISVNDGETWTLSFTSITGARTRKIFAYDENKTALSELSKISWATVGQIYTMTATITSDIKYIRVCYYEGDTDKTLVNSSYPYRTIYGGYVDLISGELVEEWIKYNLQTSIKYTKSSAGYNGWWMSVAAILGNKYQGGVNSTNPSTQLLSNVFTTNIMRGVTNKTGMNYVIKTWGGNTGSDTSQFCFSGFSSEDIEDFYSFINQYNPVICYKLATPIAHQLTPTQFSSFIGQNNIWSNADYVEVEYDLIESSDLKKVRRKIIMNSPHVETANGDVANFTTDMKAPLKSCVVNFSPIQEGSGDPSPTNVRNISGWDGVTVGLPSEYQQVEYIESTGTQYIATDYIPNQNVEIECTYQFTGHPSGDKMFFGFNVPNVTNVYVELYNSGNWYLSIGKSRYRGIGLAGIDYWTNANGNYLDVHTMKLSQSQFVSTNGADAKTPTAYWSTYSALPIYIFAWNNNGSAQYLHSALRIYSLIFTENNAEVAHYVPCYRISDGEIGMYDTVSQTFFTNSGTGTFIKGEDVNCPYISASWTDDIGTVYGGYVDLVNGELVATYGHIIIDGSFNAGIFPWQSETTDINTGKTLVHALYFKSNTGDNKHNRYATFYCNKLKNTSNYARNEMGCSMYDGNTYSVTLTFPKEDVGETQETLSAYLSENPVEVVFELAEPIHYSLTPQQLLSLKGQNNIFSNTNGTIEVKFWTH